MELPPYARVAADIRARIDAGELRPGDRVPSAREIIREWGVAMATATKALAALRLEGLVEPVRGIGTVVRAPASPPESRVSKKEPREGKPGDRLDDGLGGGSEGEPREWPDGGRAEGEPLERPGGGLDERPKGDLRRGLAKGPGEGRRPAALSKRAIVDAAIMIADAEGIDALSMRRVATSLGVSTMALYRHVANKEALATAMIDHVYGEHALPEPPPEDWRAALELALLAEWDIYQKHPWAIRLTPLAGSVQSRALMDNAEWMLRVITAQGPSSDKAMAILTFVSAYTSGMALQGTRAVVEQYEYGLDVEHWWRSREQEFRRIAAEGRYPVTFSITGPPNVRIIFELGMHHLLDGLKPLIEAD